jgi:poly(A) polymerase
VRFASRFDLRIDPATLAALKGMAGEVVVVSPERIAQELRRMIVHRNRALAMDMAMEYGLIAAVLPPLVAQKGLLQGGPAQQEGDLWDHTLKVLDLLPDPPSFTLAFAALLHDVGKAPTTATRLVEESSHDYETIGGCIADELGRGLKLSNAERERVMWLVTHHRRLVDASTLPASKLKRVLSEPGIDELLALHRADALASTGDASHVDYCEDYLRNEPSGPINPLPLLTGRDLLEHGLKPGARFAIILDRVRDEQLDGRITSKQEALEWIDREAIGERAEPGGS